MYIMYAYKRTRMELVVLAGDPCSGKTTAADCLGNAGYPVIGMGRTLRQNNPHASESEVWDRAQELRSTHGPHGVAVPCAEPLERAFQQYDTAVLEGSRNPAESSYLAGRFDVQVRIIWIEAPDEARESRFAEREGRGQDPEMLEERTRRERDAGMAEYEQYADHVIQNDGTVAELSEELSSVLG